MGNSKEIFSNLKLYIGIDVHKKNWSVSIFSDAAHHRTFCQPASAIALKTYLSTIIFQVRRLFAPMKLPNSVTGSIDDCVNLDINVWW